MNSPSNWAFSQQSSTQRYAFVGCRMRHTKYINNTKLRPILSSSIHATLSVWIRRASEALRTYNAFHSYAIHILCAVRCINSFNWSGSGFEAGRSEATFVLCLSHIIVSSIIDTECLWLSLSSSLNHFSSFLLLLPIGTNTSCVWCVNESSDAIRKVFKFIKNIEKSSSVEFEVKRESNQFA